jgi:predicted transcriptional regulator
VAFTVQNLIDDRPRPVTVSLNDTVQTALELMFEHDYSQLPVVDNKGRVVESKEKKANMVTSDSILHALSNFRILPDTDTLLVSDAMVQTSTFGTNEDPFELFKELRDNQAVLVEEGDERIIIGIVTSFDATAFFRRRAEDIILVEEIENTIKDYIMLYFKGSIGEAGQAQLQLAIEAIMPSHNKLKDPFRQALSHYLAAVGGNQTLNEETAQEAFTKHLHRDKAPSFDDLSLNQYIDLFTNKSRWNSYRNAFRLEREAIIRLLDDVRKIRNKLMHFREEISINERTQLRYCKNWLERRRSKVEEIFPLKNIESDTDQSIGIVEVPLSNSLEATTVSEFVNQLAIASDGHMESVPVEIKPFDEMPTSDDSHYAPLALYLLNKPTNVEGENLTFKAIEEIIEGKLPASARQTRSWWANDSVGHVQSQQWLDVGWRVSYVDMKKETVLFTRIYQREDLYTDFFRALHSELSQVTHFSLRPYSSQGRNWMTVAQLPGSAFLGFSFARRKRFRVELYIYPGDKEKNKQLFDALYMHKFQIQAELESVPGSFEWERIDDKRASRIAIYRDGSIRDDADTLSKLREWAIDAMPKFQKVMERHISEVL